MKDYYGSLGVSKEASPDEIKQAYKKLAKQFHPDINKSKDAEAKFKEINEAYSVVGDEKKRQHYDRFGSEPQAGAQGFEGFEGFNVNLDDIFSEFFGFSGGGRRGGRQRGEDIGIEVTLTLEEAADGKEQKVSIDRAEHCHACKGTGAEGGKRINCNTCKGAGSIRRATRTPFGVMQTATTCTDCGGSGSSAEKQCKECDGTGLSLKEKTFTVDIPAGVGDGMQLRVPGAGHQATGTNAAGDLLVLITLEEHELFVREGDNLHIQSVISYPQAVFGTNLEVPTLHGNVKLAIPSGTESGTIFKVHGKGMPRLRGGRGDLLVTVKISVPKHPSKQERELLEKLLGVEKPKGFFERFKL